MLSVRERPSVCASRGPASRNTDSVISSMRRWQDAGFGEATLDIRDEAFFNLPRRQVNAHVELLRSPALPISARDLAARFGDDE